MESFFRRRRTGSPNTRAMQIQSLEPRVVLAAEPFISEFQASNAATLADEDNDFSDWIEIHNPDESPSNLSGWYLTDEPTDLRKWRIPDGVSLAEGSHLVIYASGKNRVLPNQPLHTDFKLSASGEHLALVKPDGTTIVQSFDFPAQSEDVSYGIAAGREVTELIPRSNEVSVLVPTDGSLGTDWTDPTFDDTAWQSGTSGVGYETTEQGFTVRYDFSEPLGPEWTVDNPGSATVELVDGSLSIATPENHETTSEDRGIAPIVFHEIPTFDDGSTPDQWEIVTHVTQQSSDRGVAGILIYDGTTQTPAITLAYASRSRFELRAAGDRKHFDRDSGEDSYFLRLTRDDRAQTWGAFYKLLEDDPWIYLGAIADGLDDVPIVLDPKPALFTLTTSNTMMTASFDFAEFIVADERTSYESSIALNVKDEFSGKNSSIYTRMPFTLGGNPSQFDELRMDVRFDDGYRAYLNGTLISEHNTPLPPPPPAPNVLPWNAHAEGTAGARRGQIPVTQIDVIEFRDALSPGQNVLAVHGLNVAADDRDFFFDAQLFGTQFVAGKEQVFTSPTPGAANLLPAASPPEILTDQGLAFGSVTVEIGLAEPLSGLEIRYTLDGSDPTQEALLYTSPFVLTGSAMIQARVFDASPEPIVEPSSMSAATVIVASEDLRNRTSDIPIIVLDTLEERLPGSATNQLRRANVVAVEVSRATGRASLSNGNVDYVGRGGLRDRGSSTASQPKPNMTFETWGPNGTDKDDDENVGLLGFSSESDWVLHAPHNFDRAMIRNQLAYGLSNQIGQWAPKTRAVEVYLNRRDTVVDESDYMGVYVLTEKISQGAGRLDIAAISPEDQEEPDVTGGYIWKVDRADPDAGRLSAGGIEVNWVYPKSPSSRTARDDQKATGDQQRWVTSHFRDVANALRRADIADPDGYSKYIDVPSWVDHHLLSVLMDDVDAFALSAYLFKDRGGKIHMGPLWDFDRSAESLDNRDDDPERWGGSGGSNFFSRNWYTQVFRDPGFWQAYVDRWTELRRTSFSLDNVDALIDKLAGEVEESQERNYLATVNRTVRPRTRSAYISGKLDGTWQGEVEHLRKWLHDRIAFIDSNFAQPPVFFLDDQEIEKVDPDTREEIKGIEVTPGQQIKITGPKIVLFDDTPFVSNEVGATTAKYFIPTDDSLGDDWAAPDFDDSQWPSGQLGIGFDTTDPDTGEITGDLGPLIATPIQNPTAVQEGGTTVFTRVEFDVADLEAIQSGALTLRMQYDDGFVAYLNGTEVLQQNLRDDLAWDGRSSTRQSSRDNEIVENPEDFDLSEYTNLIVEGRNVLAIRGINSSTNSGDFVVLPGLVSRHFEFGISPTATVYYTTDATDPRGPDGMPSASAILVEDQTITINENTRIIARAFDETNRGTEARIVRTDWSGITQFDVSVAASPLVISEIQYNPSEPTQAELDAGFESDDFEFMELHNPSDSPTSLVGIELTDGVEFDFLDSDLRSLDANGHVVIASNPDALRTRYGQELPIAGSYNGQLDNAGEDVDLVDATGQIIFSVNYGDGDPWPVRSDGSGASLELINPANVDVARQSKWYSWRASSENGGSPGRSGNGEVGIAINEIIANTQGDAVDLRDSIELLNTSQQDIDLSGWYLSDSANALFKFAIPAGTVIAPGQYLVYDEQNLGFGLSGLRGDSVWLVHQDSQGRVDLFGDDVHFGPTINGESMGRLPNGSGRLTPLERHSLGAENSTPRVGPVVVSEIQYNSVVSDAALAIDPFLEGSDLEFVEIHNPTAADVNLTNWRLRGGADFNFEDEATLPAGETLVVVKFNPENPDNVNRVRAFREYYGMSDDVRLLGGYAGQLNNSDDRVVLQRSETTTDDAVYHVQEDEVLYDDLAPWPIGADGTGQSLQRTTSDAFGNQASSWFAGAPTPGTIAGGIPGDFDDNAEVNAMDIDLLFAQIRAGLHDARFDLTGDGLVDDNDRDRMIKQIVSTAYGDANLDRIFNSSDLVEVFSRGEYEDGTALNSGWEDGDWDGDGDFSTSDLVLAFRDGKYVP